MLKYLVSLSLFSLSLIILLIIFNFLVDPYLFLTNRDVKNNFGIYPALDINMQITKSNEIKRIQPDNIIMGDSMAAIAFNPSSEYLGNSTSYNGAVYGSNLHQVYRLYQDVVRIYSPKTIIIALNFYQFNKNVEDQDLISTSMDYDISGEKISKIKKYRDILKLYFSSLSLKNSAQSILSSSDLYNHFGFLNTEGVQSKLNNFSSLGAEPQNRTRFCKVADKSMILDLKNFEYFPTSHNKNPFKLLQSMIEMADDKDINLEFIILPINARQIYIIDAMGLWDEYQSWKSNLVRVLGKEGGLVSGESFDLVDFSIINAVTRNKCKESLWYPDSSHVIPEIGDKILKTIFSGEYEGDFGYKLTHKTILQALELDTNNLKEFIKNNKETTIEIDSYIQ